MTDYEYIDNRLRSEMVSGQMHLCLRDVGRIVGGYLSSERLSSDEVERLKNLAVSLSINKKDALHKWVDAVEYGRRQPLQREAVPARREHGHAVDWEDKVNADDYRIVDTNWLEKEVIVEPTDWNPCAQLKEYLSLMFKPDEHVAYCTDPVNRNGKFIPVFGVCNKTVADIVKYLNKNTDTGFSEAVGTTNPACGAWIVINPVDGEGRKDENITDFRYALVECDEKPIEEQVAIYRKLELPCACIVHSGGKSAHAIVRIEAADKEEYRKRVDFLFDVCEKNGLPIDKQNRNPSRFSRMPGVVRGEGRQFIISRNCGKPSWNDWEEWIREQNDDLPDFEPFTAELFNNPPPLAEELISGVLRVGDNMIISGPPKAGKSFLLIDLCIAVSTGGEWIGHKCAQGDVAYVNLELNRASCIHRIIDVCNEKRIPPPMIGNEPSLNIWNLRGKALPIDKLAPRLIRRVNKMRRKIAMIVIDPAYLVFPGDENSAADTGLFMRSLIHIAAECRSTVVLCHHHSKGSQGDKRSMDRASGSGVFSRSPDAILDLLPLEADSAREQFMQSYEIAAMSKAADEQDYADTWRKNVSTEDLLVPNRLAAALGQMFDDKQMDAVRNARDKVKEEFESVTGWRVSYSLRDFRSPAPKNLWFKYPCHLFDDDGVLKECSPEGESASPWKRRAASKKPKEKVDKVAAFKQIIEFDPKEVWTVSKAMERFGVSERSVKRYLGQLGWATKNGVIVVPEKTGEAKQDDVPF